MKLGVFTALFAGLTLDQVIEKVTAAGSMPSRSAPGPTRAPRTSTSRTCSSSKAKAKAYKRSSPTRA